MMTKLPQGRATSRSWAALDTAGVGATLLLPLFLTHVRVMSEIALDVLAVLFLVRSACGAGWHWVRLPWVRVAFLWWGWQAICSLPGIGLQTGGALTQALLAIRFPLAAAAMQNWTLREERPRRWMKGILIGCCLYIVAQMLLQAITGVNLFGYPRFADGTLTGPYEHPRAAAPLSRLFPPVLMAGCAWIATRRQGLSATAGMTALSVAAVSVMILAGQRIPMALTVLGLMVCAAFYRPLRPPVLVALGALPFLVLLARIVSPGSFQHLIILASHQLAHFGQSHYGALLTRALVMAQAHPVMGLGYDAFRHGCADPAYFHTLSWMGGPADGGARTICVQHAHNHYLQALTNSGVPGLCLFTAMVTLWLVALWPVAGANRAWRIGLFAAVFIQEWPIASSSDFLNLPLGGWAFLLLGTGLAEAASVRHGPQRLYPHGSSVRTA